MKFYQKCMILTTPDILTTNPEDVEYPESIQKKLDTLVINMKPKMDILDKVNIPYIEKVFDMKPEVIFKYLNESCDGDIPDGVINVLSTKLYAKDFNDMSAGEQAIIKVLSVYLMIQN